MCCLFFSLVNLSFILLLLLLFFWPSCRACGFLVPRPGIEPTPLAAKAQSANHWTAREFPICLLSVWSQPMNLRWVERKNKIFSFPTKPPKAAWFFTLSTSLPSVLHTRLPVSELGGEAAAILQLKSYWAWEGAVRRQGTVPTRRLGALAPRFPGKWRRNNRQLTFAANQSGWYSLKESTQKSLLGPDRFDKLEIWVACLLFGVNLGKLKKSNQGLRPFEELLLHNSHNIHPNADLKIRLCNIKNVTVIFLW